MDKEKTKEQTDMREKFMKRLMLVGICVIMLSGCGGDSSAESSSKQDVEKEDATEVVENSEELNIDLTASEYEQYEYLMQMAEKGNEDAEYLAILSSIWVHHRHYDDPVKSLEEIKDERPYALCMLSKMYFNGGFYGIKTDEEKARAYMEEAKSKLDMNSQKEWAGSYLEYYINGELYSSGFIVEQNIEEAIKWYEKSADLGFIDAMIALGDLYYSKYGVLPIEPNYEKAVEWYEKAAQNLNERNSIDYNYVYGYLAEINLNKLNDYAKALEYYIKVGDASAAREIAVMYLGGFGVEQDYAKALEWFEKANNDFWIGYMYQEGLGVEQDYAKAKEYYEKDYELGPNTYTMYWVRSFLGEMYYYGLGVEQDYVKALKYYEESSNRLSYYRLSEMYSNGYGCEKDPYNAVYYFEKAGSGEFGDIGMYDVCTELERRISPDIYADVGEAYGLTGDYTTAMTYLTKALEASDAAAGKACRIVGEYYNNGTGVEQNWQKAVENWTIASVVYGDAIATRYLGRAFYNRGDYENAMAQFLVAAEAGDVFSTNQIGLMYLDGYGVSVDYDKAREWFEKAVEQGLTAAKCNIGVSYYYQKDYANALIWLEESAEEGNSGAMGWLAYMYANGDGVEKNKELANEWQEKYDNATAK